MADLVVTIDGPAASGKSTVAQILAEKIGASFLDTGAMYRAVTLAAIEAGMDMNEEKQLLEVMESSKFDFSAKKGKMFVQLNCADVTERLREPALTARVRHIASLPKLREKLVHMQRQFAAEQEKIVTEGRDQGTVAFPDADIKFFLTATAAERAKRRQAQLQCNGINQSLKQIQSAIEKRDKNDKTRAVGPLKPANDAIIIDTTNLSIEGVVEKIMRFMEEKCSRRR